MRFERRPHEIGARGGRERGPLRSKDHKRARTMPGDAATVGRLTAWIARWPMSAYICIDHSLGPEIKDAPDR